MDLIIVVYSILGIGLFILIQQIRKDEVRTSRDPAFRKMLADPIFIVFTFIFIFLFWPLIFVYAAIENLNSGVVELLYEKHKRSQQKDDLEKLIDKIDKFSNQK